MSQNGTTVETANEVQAPQRPQRAKTSQNGTTVETASEVQAPRDPSATAGDDQGRARSRPGRDRRYGNNDHRLRTDDREHEERHHGIPDARSRHDNRRTTCVTANSANAGADARSSHSAAIQAQRRCTAAAADTTLHSESSLDHRSPLVDGARYFSYLRHRRSAADARPREVRHVPAGFRAATLYALSRRRPAFARARRSHGGYDRGVPLFAAGRI